MSVSDIIEELLNKENVVELAILKNPQQGTICIQATQSIVTGTKGDRLNAVHQAEASCFVEALEKIRKTVGQVGDMATMIIHVKEK